MKWFLDFDGVLCDSAEECYIVSVNAYSRMIGANRKVGDSDRRAFFDRLRPFIRGAGDYVMIQLLFEEGLAPETQEEFDRILRAFGNGESMRRLFIEVRREFRRDHYDMWLSKNPLYPGVFEALAGWSENQDVFILSAKREAEILDILRGKGIVWPEDRVLPGYDRPKGDIILETLNSGETGVFVDDQPDHFQGLDEIRVKPVLALWGYPPRSGAEGCEAWSLEEFLLRVGAQEHGQLGS